MVPVADDDGGCNSSAKRQRAELALRVNLRLQQEVGDRLRELADVQRALEAQLGQLRGSFENANAAPGAGAVAVTAEHYHRRARNFTVTDGVARWKSDALRFPYDVPSKYILRTDCFACPREMVVGQSQSTLLTLSPPPSRDAVEMAEVLRSFPVPRIASSLLWADCPTRVLVCRKEFEKVYHFRKQARTHILSGTKGSGSCSSDESTVEDDGTHDGCAAAQPSSDRGDRHLTATESRGAEACTSTRQQQARATTDAAATRLMRKRWREETFVAERQVWQMLVSIYGDDLSRVKSHFFTYQFEAMRSRHLAKVVTAIAHHTPPPPLRLHKVSRWKTNYMIRDEMWNIPRLQQCIAGTAHIAMPADNSESSRPSFAGDAARRWFLFSPLGRSCWGGVEPSEDLRNLAAQLAADSEIFARLTTPEDVDIFFSAQVLRFGTTQLRWRVVRGNTERRGYDEKLVGR